MVAGDAIMPGAIAFTVMPYAPSAPARNRVRPFSSTFDAGYAKLGSSPVCRSCSAGRPPRYQAPIEESETMRPPVTRMAGRTARAVRRMLTAL